MIWPVQDPRKAGVDASRDADIKSIVADGKNWTEEHPLATKLLVAATSIVATYVTKWILDKIDARKEK